ncbi:isochorismatase family protein [Pseudomonas syringae]|uniref:isochorismatase family protein n=1 Tax=Pseudomonas sp. MWU16-30316 TaxID=2878093 RepID=UPI0010FFFFC7|nr:isochorismatase family protein [Pseudomonas sp. MWU16-30316]TFZ34305.1 isochorismatase family protein [Pseudomonas syringae]
MRDFHGNQVDQLKGRPDGGQAGRRSLLKVTAALLGATLIPGISSRVMAEPTDSENKPVSASAGRSSSSMGRFEARPQDVQILFVDLQDSLTHGSRSITPAALRNNAGVLAKIARLLGIPMTFSLVPVKGKPGELISELRPYSNAHNTSQRLLAPSFTDEAMVASLANNRRQTLIICGFATEVAVLESALGAINSGYTVHVPVDVIGSASSRTESAALRQMELAGALPTSIISLAAKWSPNFSEEPGASVLAAFSEIQTTN